MHVDLVVVHEQRYDVTGLKEVAARIDDAIEARQIARWYGHRAFEVVDLLAGQIATVFQRWAAAGDVPSAPAFGERGIGSDVGAAGAAEGFAV